MEALVAQLVEKGRMMQDIRVQFKFFDGCPEKNALA
jgi:hypothetical protein